MLGIKCMWIGWALRVIAQLQTHFNTQKARELQLKRLLLKKKKKSNAKANLPSICNTRSFLPRDVISSLPNSLGGDTSEGLNCHSYTPLPKTDNKPGRVRSSQEKTAKGYHWEAWRGQWREAAETGRVCTQSNIK